MQEAIFLSGSGNLNRSDFDHSNLFQSYKQRSVNIDHRLKSKLSRTIRKTSMKLKCKLYRNLPGRSGRERGNEQFFASGKTPPSLSRENIVKCLDDWQPKCTNIFIIHPQCNQNNLEYLQDDIIQGIYPYIFCPNCILNSIIALSLTLTNFLIQESRGPSFILEMTFGNSLKMPSHSLLIEFFNIDLCYNCSNFLTTH